MAVTGSGAREQRAATLAQLIVAVVAVLVTLGLAGVTAVLALQGRLTTVEVQVHDANLPQMAREITEIHTDVRLLRQDHDSTPRRR